MGGMLLSDVIMLMRLHLGQSENCLQYLIHSLCFSFIHSNLSHSLSLSFALFIIYALSDLLPFSFTFFLLHFLSPSLSFSFIFFIFHFLSPPLSLSIFTILYHSFLLIHSDSSLL